jgi:anti-sigma-K factor RskA
VSDFGDKHQGVGPDDRADDGRAEAGEVLRPECARIDPDLAELALGALTGKERVAALAHLEDCARCSTEVDELAAAADQLLHLAPAVEPPVGFEARVFERLGLRPAPVGWRSWSIWRPKLALAAAAGAVVVAFGLGALLGHGTSGGGPARYPEEGAAAAPIHVAALYSGGRAVGRVMVYAGNPTWLFMYMDDANWQGTLRCEVVLDQGAPVVLGKFWLSGGKGAWAASLAQPAGRLSQARVVGPAGNVLASADLS